MSLLGVVKHELKQVGLVTLYFLFCFDVTLVLKKLFLVACATFSPAEGKRQGEAQTTLTACGKHHILTVGK